MPTTPRLHQKAEAPIVSSSSTLCLAACRIVFNLALGHLIDHGRSIVRAWHSGARGQGRDSPMGGLASAMN
jgi:hypothetical protein